MRFFTQSIRITPNKIYGAAPMFTGVSEVDLEGKRIKIAMQSKNRLYGSKEYDESMPVFTHKFDGISPLMIDFKWEINPETNKITESDQQKRESAVLNFLKQHENTISSRDMRSDGQPVRKPKNSNLKLPIFIMEILEDTLTEKIELWDKELKVKGIIANMTEEERAELCYLYGLNPKNMIDMQSKISLAGQGGVIFNPENMDKFLEMMGDKESSVKEVFDKVLFNKAKIDGVIVYSDGSFRTSEGTIIGMREDDVLMALKDDASLRNMLSKRLNQNAINFLQKVKDSAGNADLKYQSVLDMPFEEKKQWAKDNKVPHAGITNDEEKLNRNIESFLRGKAMMGN
jgi:hypothetical protein